MLVLDGVLDLAPSTLRHNWEVGGGVVHVHLDAGEGLMQGNQESGNHLCSDCHTATGVHLKVTGQETVAWDANCFHHLKGGVCSCGDYW